jgi:hypothetical protein
VCVTVCDSQLRKRAKIRGREGVKASSKFLRLKMESMVRVPTPHEVIMKYAEKQD